MSKEKKKNEKIENTEVTEEVNEENLSPQEVKDLLEKVEKLQLDLEKATAEANKWKNEYYQAYADLANTRKQIEKDNENYRSYLSMNVIDNFLTTFDALELSLNHDSEDEKVKKFISGNKMIFKMILSNLENLGFTTYLPANGEDFDANKMNAIETVDGEVENKVFKATCRGYYYKDRILRPANVVVTKLASKENKE